MSNNEIPGWFDFADLYEEAAERFRPGDLVVEIGSFMGASSVCLGHLAKARNAGVWCIDPFTGTPGHPVLSRIVAECGGTYYPIWQRNINEAGLHDVVLPLIDYSPDAAAQPEFDNLQSPFVFIDGDHSLDAVRADVRAWLPKVRPGGLLAGHDYDRKSTVWRAVQERFGTRAQACSRRSWKVEVCGTRTKDRQYSFCAVINFTNADRWVIERTIDAVAPYVSGVVAIDTSPEGEAADETAAVLGTRAHENGLPCNIWRRPWTDYADSQNYLLSRAEVLGFEWAWILDSDEEVREAPTGEPLSHLWDLDPRNHAYHVCVLYGSDHEVWKPRIVKLGAGWRFEGKRHANLTRTDCSLIERLTALEVVHHDDYNVDGIDRDRYARDVVHFERLVAENPRNERAWYYLAQSARMAGFHGRAIEAYQRRVCNWDRGYAEEAYISAIELARLTRVPGYYYQAIDMRPHRKEARRELCAVLRSQGRLDEALEIIAPAARSGPSKDRFLVRRSDEQWRARLEWLHVLTLQGANVMADLITLYEDHPNPEVWEVFEWARTREAGQCP